MYLPTNWERMTVLSSLKVEIHSQCHNSNNSITPKQSGINPVFVVILISLRDSWINDNFLHDKTFPQVTD